LTGRAKKGKRKKAKGKVAVAWLLVHFPFCLFPFALTEESALMEKEDQATPDRGLFLRSGTAPESVPSSAAPGPVGQRTGRSSAQTLGRVVAGGVAVVACLVGLVLFLRVPPSDGVAQPKPGKAPEGSQLQPLFVGWDKPDVAIALSGQQYGYLQPCGCSEPQYGGLARRYNFLAYLKDHRGWPLVAVDLGDIPDQPKRHSQQTLLKYVYSLKSLREMSYSAVGFGLNEMSLPLHEAMNSYALNNPSPPVVNTSLLTREKQNDPFFLTVKASAVGGGGKTPRVGVLALVAPSVREEAKKINDDDLKFRLDATKALEHGLAEVRSKNVEFVVLLYQGSLKEARGCAQYCAQRHKADKNFPAINVILRLDDELPSGVPEKVGDSMIVGVGHKGRHIGVIGAFRTGKADEPWQIRYQLVQLGPEYETPEGKDHQNPIHALMEEYAQDVKDANFLAKHPRKKHPVQITFNNAEYVGSGACKGCHPAAYKIWKDSGHAHAYATLEGPKAIRPKNRQYDPECIVCHVVGFPYETGFTDAIKTHELKNVGCESCHGPCSEHVANRNNLKIRAAINPFKAPPGEKAEQRIRRMNAIDMFCQSCHDVDNDVHWDFGPKWPKIIHMTPRNGK